MQDDPLNRYSNDRQIANDHYDVIVIGAGVVGCAMTRRFAMQGAKVLLVEKSSDILAGASKANSAILHTGFDEVTNSVEHQCVSAGYQEFLEIRQQMKLPILKTGALVVAWNAEQAAKLEGLHEKALLNGVSGVRRLTAQQVANLEPNLACHQAGALSVEE